MQEDSERNIKKNATSDGCRGNIRRLQNMLFFSERTLFHYLDIIHLSNNQKWIKAEIFIKERMDFRFLDSIKEYLQRISTHYTNDLCVQVHTPLHQVGIRSNVHADKGFTFIISLQI